MERDTVNTVVTIAVIALVAGYYSRPFFQQEARKEAEPAERVLLIQPTEEAGKAALAKMRVEFDKIEGFRRYAARTTPIHFREKTGVYLSFLEYPTHVRGMMHVTYAGDDWIFFDSLATNCDGIKYELKFNPEQHVGSDGKVEEWATVSILTRGYFEFLYDCATAKESTIRLKGKFYYDHKMGSKEKQAILDTLVALQAKGGTLDLPR